MSHSKLRYALGIFFVLILVGAFYSIDYFSKNKSYQTIEPENYEKGTMVSLYDKLPNGFPKEFVLEDFVLDYVGDVESPDKNIETTASFISRWGVLEVVNTYRNELDKNGWMYFLDSTSPESFVFTLKKDNKNVLISISFVTKDKTMITVQYQQ